MPEALQFESLQKRYGRREVLRGLDLSLEEGRILGFFGLNGAGKSTTARILLGFARPSAGRCLVFGRPSGDPAARAHLGYLPENPYYYEYLTGREVLDYAGRLSGVPAPERARRIREGVEKVRLAPEAADRLVRTYSRGMRQRLGIAQAFLHRPKLLLLDEPFSGLDPLGRMMLKELLREYRAGGGTVFFNSHQLLDAQEICDRVAILHAGRLAVDTELRELTARHPGMTLEQIFLEYVGPAAPEGGEGDR